MDARLNGFVDELVKLSENPRPYESGTQYQKRKASTVQPTVNVPFDSSAQQRSRELARINRSLRNTQSLIMRMNRRAYGR